MRQFIAKFILAVLLGILTCSVAFALPDLYVSSLNYSPSDPTAGQRVTISWTVTNGGSDSSGACHTQWFLDGSSRSSEMVPSLSPGASYSNHLTCDFSPSSPGTYDVRVVADVNGVVSESNESNNQRTTSVYVTAPPTTTTSTTTTTTIIATTTTVPPTTTITPTTSTTSTTLGNAYYHLRIINNDDDNYANVYYQLERSTGGLTTSYSISANSGQTVTTPSRSITPGTYRSILRWMDPDKGTEDVYRDGGYVTIDAGEDHEFTKYIPLYTGTTTTTTSTTITPTSTSTTTSIVSTTTTLPNQPPQISILSPSNGAEVSGNVDILVEAIDPEDLALSRIEYFIDGVLKNTDSSPDPMTPASSWEWDSTQVTNGVHTIRVVGYDSDGASNSRQINVTVNNSADQPPEVNIISPADGAEVSGIVTVSVSGFDPEDGALDHIDYYIDNVRVHTDNAPLPATPASVYVWDTSTISTGGFHTLKVIGYDSKGNSAQDQITVDVVHLGSVNVAVMNIGGAVVSGAEVLRFSLNSSYVDSRITGADGIARWNEIETGSYTFAVYYNSEFWGNPPGAIVRNGSSISIDFTRYMPYGESVTCDKTIFNNGEQASIGVAVRNNDNKQNNVKVELILDRSSSAPYDFDQTVAVRTIGANSTATFTFNFTAPAAGTYYRKIKVYTNVDGTDVLTDDWNFGGLDALQLILPTTEACGYLKLGYNAASTLDEVAILIDDNEVLRESNSAFSGGYRPVTLDVLALLNGQHNIKLQGLKDNKKVIETAVQLFYVDNNIKICLVGEGKIFTYPLPEDDPILDFFNLENYKIVVRRPFQGAPYFTDVEPNLAFNQVETNIGFLYELPLKNRYFEEYGTVTPIDNYLHLRLPDAYPKERTLKIQASYNLLDDNSGVLDSLTSDEDVENIISIITKFDELMNTPDKVNVLLEQGEVRIDDYYLYKIEKVRGEYHLDAVGEIVKENKLVRYKVEVSDVNYFLKIDDGQVVKSNNFYDFLDILEREYQKQSGNAIKYADVSIKAENSEFFLTLNEREIIKKSIVRSDGVVEISGANSADDVLDSFDYTSKSIIVKNKAVLRSIEIDESNSLKRAIGKGAKILGWITDLLSIREVEQRIKDGNLKGAIEKLTNFIAGKGGAAAGGFIGAIGGNVPGAIAGSAAGDYLASEIVKQPVHAFLYGPDSVLHLSIYPGEKANFLLNFQNEGNHPHAYEIRLACPDVSNLKQCYINDFSNEEKFILNPGENKQVMVWIAFSTLNTGGSYPVSLEVIMDNGKYSWVIPAEVELKKLLYIPECPFVSYTPSWSCDANGNCWYTCPGPSFNVSAIADETALDFFAMQVNASYSGVEINWSDINFFMPQFDVSNMQINRTSNSIEVYVPDEGDTKILAGQPATITINDVDSANVDIYHNDELVYDGVILDPVIRSIDYIEAENKLVCEVAHFDLFKFVFSSSESDTQKPQILSLKVNDKDLLGYNTNFIAGDHIPYSERMDVEAEIEDDFALTFWNLEVLDDKESVQFSQSKSLSASDAVTREVISAMASGLDSGDYKIRVTLKDSSNNEEIFVSPTFKISQAFTFSALNGPNPFSPNGDGVADTTRISYQLSSDAKIKIRIFNLNGKQLHHWNFEPGVLGSSSAGYNEVVWDGRDESGSLVRNGLYLCYILAEASGDVKKAKLQIAVLR